MDQPLKKPNKNRERHLKVVEEPGLSVYKASRIINYIFALLLGLVLIRLLLKALGGNPINGFVAFIYSITGPFVMPFLSIFRRSFVNTNIGIIELGTIVAIAFYVLLNFAIVRLIKIIASKNNH